MLQHVQTFRAPQTCAGKGSKGERTTAQGIKHFGWEKAMLSTKATEKEELLIAVFSLNFSNIFYFLLFFLFFYFFFIIFFTFFYFLFFIFFFHLGGGWHFFKMFPGGVSQDHHVSEETIAHFIICFPLSPPPFFCERSCVFSFLFFFFFFLASSKPVKTWRRPVSMASMNFPWQLPIYVTASSLGIKYTDLPLYLVLQLSIAAGFLARHFSNVPS